MKTEQFKNFTPGPWSLSTIPFELRNKDDAASIWKDTMFGNELGSAPICNISRAVGDEQATANARLIAASPTLLSENQLLQAENKELLEALEEIVWFEPTSPYHAQVREKAKQAIANATGKGEQR